MLNVLLESRAPRARRMGSTVASAVLHAALITGAVALTMPGPVKATSVEPRDPVYIVPPRHPEPPATPHARSRPTDAAPTAPRLLPTVPPPGIIPDGIPPIDLGLAPVPDDVVIGRGGLSATSPIGNGDPAIGAGGSAVDERLVDRVPRVLGRAPEPRYPASLRDAGIQGRVVVQFVVDTLGRAELGELQVVETPHAAFADAVRAALAHYRFSVGEAAGRKVRTRVQIPFEFTLTR